MGGKRIMSTPAINIYNTSGPQGPKSPFATDQSRFTAAQEGPQDGDALQLSSKAQPKTKKGFFGKIKDIGKGMWQGACSIVTGALSIKGMLTAGGLLALGVVCPWTIPVMIAGAMAGSAWSMFKAIKNGDYVGIGNALVSGALSFTGARALAPEIGGAAAASEGGSIMDAAGHLFNGRWEQLSAQAKSLVGRSKDGFRQIPGEARSRFLNEVDMEEIGWQDLRSDGLPTVARETVATVKTKAFQRWKDTGLLTWGKEVLGGSKAPITAVEEEMDGAEKAKKRREAESV